MTSDAPVAIAISGHNAPISAIFDSEDHHLFSTSRRLDTLRQWQWTYPEPAASSPISPPNSSPSSPATRHETPLSVPSTRKKINPSSSPKNYTTFSPFHHPSINPQPPQLIIPAVNLYQQSSFPFRTHLNRPRIPGQDDFMDHGIVCDDRPI